MLVCVFCNFLDDFAIAVWRGDVALDSRGIELALVFNIVERFNAGLCVDLPDLLALARHLLIARIPAGGAAVR